MPVEGYLCNICIVCVLFKKLDPANYASRNGN